MQVVLLFDSPLNSGKMGASKQLSNDLKTKIVQQYGLGEGYKKLSRRFQLSVSTVRNVIKKWKATGTVLVKARSGRPRKISEGQRQRMVRMVKDYHQTTSKVHRSTFQRTLHKEQLYGRVMRKKPFLHTRHKHALLR